MRALGVVLIGLAVLLLGVYVEQNVVASYEYEQTISSYWTLSDRASSLPLKAAYLDQFVAAVDSAHLTGHNAVFLKTPQNDVGQNIVALKSLQERMHDIRNMDVTSFQYQQAMAQITGQEQGEAQAMLDTIEGVWFLKHHPLLWDWISLLVCMGILGLGLVGVLMVSLDDW